MDQFRYSTEVFVCRRACSCINFSWVVFLKNCGDAREHTDGFCVKPVAKYVGRHKRELISASSVSA